MRLQDIREEIQYLENFDPQQRMKEIHEINESLIKIKAGKFFEDEDYQNLNSYDFSTFQAMDEVEDFFDEFTYKLEEKKPKGGRRPNKQTFVMKKEEANNS